MEFCLPCPVLELKGFFETSRPFDWLVTQPPAIHLCAQLFRILLYGSSSEAMLRMPVGIDLLPNAFIVCQQTYIF